MAQNKAAKKLLRKQLNMRRVLFALLPCVAGAVYFFGWRCLAVILWAGAVGFVTEYIFCRLRGEPVSEAVFLRRFRAEHLQSRTGGPLFCLRLLPGGVDRHVGAGRRRGTGGPDAMDHGG
jgi:hypothetical protein